MVKQYDIIIIGAGIVGLATAKLLAEQGFQVALVEKSAENNSFHPARVSAINSASKALFEQLKIWPSLQGLSTSFIDMEIWDQSKDHSLKFSATEIFQPTLGFIVPNGAMVQELLKACRLHTSIDLYFSTQIKQLTQVSIWQLDTSAGKLSASLLIGADGANSWLRQKAKFHCEIYDYQQQGLIATVQSEIARPHLAWQRFYQQDILAFLPIENRGDTWAIVWSHANSLTDQALLPALQQLTQDYFGQLQLLSSPFAYPLKRVWVKNCVKPGMVLIGDAAHSIHPLAGQGVNFGIADVIALVQILAENRRKYADFITLKRYQRQRSLMAMRYRVGIDFIKQSFATEKAWFSAIRQKVIKNLDRNHRIKQLLISFAAGKD